MHRLSENSSIEKTTIKKLKIIIDNFFEPDKLPERKRFSKKSK